MSRLRGELILDVSRLISRAGRTTPTGIDRVEFAYARHLLGAAGERVRFAAISPVGRVGALPRASAERYLRLLQRIWSGDGSARKEELAALGRALSLQALADGEAGLRRARRGGSDRATYLLVSHHHLERPDSVRRALAASGGRFLSLVHDLIPIQLPEYNRPGQDAKHAVRMSTVAALSDVVVVNSDDTAAALAPFLASAERSPPVVVAPLGVDVAPSPRVTSDSDAPYFVCISTIEPRKNHLLLFNIWRRLAAEAGRPTPRLHLVGHRGWHNEAALDVLDRSTSLRPHLTEHRALSDREMSRLLAGARALLMPSFAEGYGLPVAEALAAGTPVLCSDLPALRGVGGEVPEYLDPLDGPAWLAVVRAYAQPDSGRRAAQLERLAHWSPPTWEAHFARVEPYLSGDA